MILEMLNDDGKILLIKDKYILMAMVRKAGILIDSEYYTPIIQKMAEICIRTPHKPSDMFLQHIVDHINYLVEHEHSFPKQDKWLSLVRALIPADDCIISRTKCLLALLSRSEFVSGSTSSLKWTGGLISTTKCLLEGKADPTWVANSTEDRQSLKICTETCARQIFFGIISKILTKEENLVGPIIEIIPSFLSQRLSIHEKENGTALHFLMNTEWKWLRQVDYLPPGYFKQYKDVIIKVVEQSPVLIDLKDKEGKIPLHNFTSGLCLKEDEVVDVISILQIEEFEKGLDVRDREGRSVLHYLAKSFPVIDRALSQNRQRDVLNLIKCLTSQSNIDVQDKYGRTALHILASKFAWKVPHHSTEIFLDIMKYLASKSKESIAIDIRGQTMMHIIATNCHGFLSEKQEKLFTNLIKVIPPSSYADIQDNTGNTVLHILSRKLFYHPNLRAILLPILPRLITSQNVNDPDYLEITPYTWILKGKSQPEKYLSEQKEIWSKIENIFVENGANVNRAERGFPILWFVSKMQSYPFGEDPSEVLEIS